MTIIRLVQEDITLQEVDAIVNSANWSLFAGGGVDGAIHRAAGPGLEAEARSTYGKCATGDAVVTSAHNLKSKIVIHAVGPRYIDGLHGEPEALKSCYDRVFELVHQHKVQSMAIPAISTNIYNFPHAHAADIAIGSIHNHLISSSTVGLKEIRLIALQREQLEFYLRSFESFPRFKRVDSDTYVYAANEPTLP